MTGLRLLLACLSVSISCAQSITTLYSFTGQDGDGANPYATVSLGSGGVLYGTTSYGGTFGAGTVFELTPPKSGGNWRETVLYSFTGGNDGGYPQGGVTVGAAGVLYGAAKAGGASGMGVVFALTPPGAGGAWTEAAIYSFSGSDGSTPYAEPVVDQDGVLYGATELGGASNYGAVYELSPGQGGAWTETLLHSFASGNDGAFPYAALSRDASGNLYGTTAAGGANQKGIVFELAPPAQLGGAWTETILHTFKGSDGAYPYAGVAIGPNGSLYGSTPGGVGSSFGTVFELTPPLTGKTWTQTILQQFNAGRNGGAPHAVPAFGPDGTLLGTTLGGGSAPAWTGYGVVFELVPPATGNTWTETLLYTFKGKNDGGDPDAALVPAPGGVFYSTTLRGGAHGAGTVFAITP